MSRTHAHRRATALAATLVTTLIVATTAAATSGTATRGAAPRGAAPPGVAAVEGQSESGAATRTAVGITVTTTMTDPDDTHGRLDVRSVRHRVRQVDRVHVRMSYRLRTFSAFRDGLLDSPDREFVIELHRDDTRGAGRNITVSSSDGVLVATVISNATREPIGRAHAVRIDDRTIRISGSRQLVGARSYFVTSNFHEGGSAHCGWDAGWPVTCQDSVPDDGWIRVDRIGWPEKP